MRENSIFFCTYLYGLLIFHSYASPYSIHTGINKQQINGGVKEKQDHKFSNIMFVFKKKENEDQKVFH